MYDVHSRRAALSHTFLVKVLKQLLRDAGESPELYAGQSLGRGGATLAFAFGVHASYVVVLGDWTSLVRYKYCMFQNGILQVETCTPFTAHC
jgi:hypothetical protein